MPPHDASPEVPGTEPGRLLVEAAQAEARGQGHDFTGVEHLLLALLADPALAQAAAGIRPVPARDELRRRFAGLSGPRGAADTPYRLTSGARRLLEGAERAAREAGQAAPDRRALLERILRAPHGALAAALEASPGRGEAAPAVPPGGADAAGPRQPRERPSGDRGPRREREGRPGREAGERGERGERGDRPRRGDRRERGPRGRDAPAQVPARPKPSRPVPPPKQAPGVPLWRRVSWRDLLALVAVPLSLYLAWSHASGVLVFGVACLAVIPLAGYMGEATEHLATRTGPALGGLLNATFGNAAELIIAIVALRAGLIDLVKASITGSILGNLLLILGLSLVAGGLGRRTLTFNRVSVGASAGMLALAVVGLVFPALFHQLHPEAGWLTELSLTETVAVVLAVTYGFSLLFTLRTHHSLFSGEPHPTTHGVWSVPVAVLVLLAATVGVAVESEILVHAVEEVTATLGLSQVFLGLIVIPIIGNAAEHAAAVVVARKGKMDLALQIALGSSTQIALLVAPILVLTGVLVGQPMDLVFTPFEVLALGLATVISAIITLDGESHWFEGVQLLATYALVAATAFFL